MNFTELDPETFISSLGADYKLTTGRSGPQLNIKTCPRCHGDKWKVFLSAETGLGNCFHGDCTGQPGFNLYTFARHTLGSPSAAYKAMEAVKGSQAFTCKRTEEIKIDKLGKVVLPESYGLPNSGLYERTAGVPSYLHARGFDEKTAEHFQWRYCDQGSFAYNDYQGKPMSQRYDKRVIIPIHNLAGELVTFQGRDITGTAERKYLFPPGLPGSGRLIYNAHRAVGVKAIIICEGVFDVAATWQYLQTVKGDPFFRKFVVTGSFGKALSLTGMDCQLMALSYLKQRGLEEVVMMWDGEPAAIDAAIRIGVSINTALSLKVSVVRLPGKDPNELPADVVLRSLREAQSMQGKSSLLRHGLLSAMTHKSVTRL